VIAGETNALIAAAGAVLCWVVWDDGDAGICPHCGFEMSCSRNPRRKTQMGEWEHLTVGINYDKKKHKNWVVKRAGEPPLVGLQVILETYGSRGWELVSLNPERFLASVGFAEWHIEPRAYRATFKRPAEGRS
jgi:hypothetical protein